MALFSRSFVGPLCEAALFLVLLGVGCAVSELAIEQRQALQAHNVRPTQSTLQSHNIAFGSDTASESEDEAPSIDVPYTALLARWNALRGDPYELDEMDRFVDNAAPRLECSQEGLVNYSGTAVRYYGPVRVREPFRERLTRFEEVVAEVALEIYGRPPRRIRHFGAFSCRMSRNRSRRLSEHALGNAIDIVGFDFGPASKSEPLQADLPRQLKSQFQVRVARHWNAENGVNATHARFLRQLAERLVERRDIFRILIGPSHRGHGDHLHFDMSPWRYVHL
jgi:hypothetical protein